MTNADNLAMEQLLKNGSLGPCNNVGRKPHSRIYHICFICKSAMHGKMAKKHEQMAGHKTKKYLYTPY